MDLKALGEKVIELGAPLLGGVLTGSPAGAIVGQLIAHAFGGNISDTASVINNMTLDPDAKVKLAKIEADQKTDLAKITMQMASNAQTAETMQMDIAAKDAADARKNNAKSYIPEILSFILLSGFFLSIWLVIKVKQGDPQDHDVLYMMLGSLSAAFGAVVQFWFGSSAGSREKDQIMKNLSSN
jgi:hypothetical protein